MRAAVLLFSLLAACGPDRSQGDDDPSKPCTPGRISDCYEGSTGTENVGPCHKGSRTCDAQGVWGACTGQVLPQAESCTNGLDDNCNGMTDENVDLDGDGFTTCGGDCCDSTECSDGKLVNPGAFDAPGNNLDDDCNGMVDDTQLACDTGLATNSGNAMDYAKALELCQTATPADKKWGVVSAELTLTDGGGTPAAKSHSIRPRFGANLVPKSGASFIELSTGAAAGRGDSNPGFQAFQRGVDNGTSSAFPADFLAANGNKLPNTPGCPGTRGTRANDPVMLTLTIRVPTNAKSFTLNTNFFSSEFPEFTCSPFNDFFVVLLDSAFSGTPANPTDKNLAFYAPMGTTQRYPVGVNLAAGNTGLFTQCVNGPTGCELEAVDGNISTCKGTEQIVGTGFDDDTGGCGASDRLGGGTGWLVTAGNVNPGETIKLRIAIWDTSDHILDSLAVIDSFQWSVDAAEPGTVIFRKEQ